MRRLEREVRCARVDAAGRASHGAGRGPFMRAALPIVLTRLLLVAPERPVRRDVAMHQHHSLHLEYTAHRTIGASPTRDYMDGADML
jgi:hypothetical protein